MMFKRLKAPHASGEPSLDHLVTIWPTAASPPGFAPPIEAVEHADAFVLTFDIRGSTPEEISVHASEGTIIVERATPHARRTFSFAKLVDPDRLEQEYTTTTLTVRITKREISRSRQIIVRR